MRDVVCEKDCPERSATCHAECQKYLDFYERNAKEVQMRYEGNEKLRAQIKMSELRAERIQKMRGKKR